MRHLPLTLLCLGLAACASAPAPRPGAAQDWEERAALLQPIQSWELQGRIAIQTGDDSWSGTLDWRQRPDGYHIQFTGPLGQGNLSLSGDGHQALLRTPEGEIAGPHGPEALLLERTGWRVPVGRLQHWVLGRPAPDAPVEELRLDGQGRPETLRQDDWTVTYRRYRPVGALDLPDKVFINNHRLSVRLAIDQWRFPDPQSAEAARL